MLNRFAQAIASAALLEAGDRVLCAVSGGADSVALLLLLQQLSLQLPFTLKAAHLDHGLRPESGDDARFVEELCRSLQVPLRVESADVRELASERGEGLEAAGRFARRRFLERLASEDDCNRIALGHHANDQAETVLFRLLRGSGLTGLAAMRPRSGLYIRPLLSFEKGDLQNWLRATGVSWREDASNLDPAFSRNLIRTEVLPELRRLNPQVDGALCRFSSQVALEEGFWREQVDGFLAAHLENRSGQDVLVLPIAPLSSAHPALRRRILRGLLELFRGHLDKIEAGHIDQIEALLEGAKPQAETCLPGVRVARRYELLHVRSAPPVRDAFEVTIPEEGVYPLPTGDRLVVTLGAGTPGDGDSVAFCAEQLTFPLLVRSVRPGDRFQPSGMTGHKRLKNYFIDNKVPREERQSSVVVCAASTILWLAGRRRCEGFWPRSGGPVLQMRFERGDFVDD